MDVPKIGFSKILYTTDLSESGRFAFAYAASLAHQYGATLSYGKPWSFDVAGGHAW